MDAPMVETGSFVEFAACTIPSDLVTHRARDFYREVGIQPAFRKLHSPIFAGRIPVLVTNPLARVTTSIVTGFPR